MRVKVSDSPRLLGQTPGNGRWITFHVLSGVVQLADEQQQLFNGGGLPLETHDGLSQLYWYGPVWISAAAGTVAEIEIVIPS